MKRPSCNRPFAVGVFRSLGCVAEDEAAGQADGIGVGRRAEGAGVDDGAFPGLTTGRAVVTMRALFSPEPLASAGSRKGLVHEELTMPFRAPPIGMTLRPCSRVPHR